MEREDRHILTVKDGPSSARLSKAAGPGERVPPGPLVRRSRGRLPEASTINPIQRRKEDGASRPE
ncbi:hypothetical protein J31TS4_25320 [Paenibacillus sp. J31TS4]|nr:hypothetical protein J31TS4_25320 [Paenibacillus sp. J31TS4]